MFREIILPIFRSTRLCVTACGIMHLRCCRPTAGNIVGVLPLYHAAVILPLLPTQLNLNMTLIRRTSGRRLAPSIKAAPFLISIIHCYSASVGIFTAAWLRNSSLCRVSLQYWVIGCRRFETSGSVQAVLQRLTPEERISDHLSNWPTEAFKFPDF